MMIDELINTANNNALIYEDSMKLFEFPLSMSQDQTTFELKIADESYGLTFTYLRAEALREDRNVEIKLSDIYITELIKFDSSSCVTGCENEKESDSKDTS